MSEAIPRPFIFEVLSELEKTTIFLETVVRNLSQMRDTASPQRTFLEGHIELNRAVLAKAARSIKASSYDLADARPTLDVRAGE